MKPTPDQLARGLAASYALRDHGDHAAKVKPISFTGDPAAHVEVIGEAVLPDFENTAIIEAGVIAWFGGRWPEGLTAGERWKIRSDFRRAIRTVLEAGRG